VIFDWDEAGFKSFLSDPEVPAIIKEAGQSVSPRRRRSAAGTAPKRRSTGRSQDSGAPYWAPLFVLFNGALGHYRRVSQDRTSADVHGFGRQSYDA
jgi:hypothetical protein